MLLLQEDEARVYSDSEDQAYYGLGTRMVSSSMLDTLDEKSHEKLKEP